MSSAANAFKYRRKNTQIVCWPGDEKEIVLSYDGNQFFFAGASTAYSPTDRVKHRFQSAVDPMTGKAIPGTTVIEDVYGTDQESGEPRIIVDAGTLVEGMFGDRGLHKAYVARGLQVVDSVEQVGAAMAAGRLAWEENYTDSAINTIREEQMRQELWKKTGVMPPPASPDVRKADEFLRTKAARRRTQDLSTADLQETLNKVMGIETKPEVGRVRTLPASQVPPEDPEEDKHATSEALINAAEELKVPLSKADYKGLAVGDQGVILSLQKRLLEAEEKVTAPVAK